MSPTANLPRKHVQDTIVGLVVISFSILCFMQIRNVNPNSAMFPKLIILLMSVSGAGITVSALMHIIRIRGNTDAQGSEDRTATDHQKSYLDRKSFFVQLLIPGGILLVICLLLRHIGFYLATFMLTVAFMVFQEYAMEGRVRMTKRFILATLYFSSGTSVVMWVLFTVLLNMPTPRGFLGI